MGILFANSLLDGFLKSNFTGQGIVLIQIALSVLMFSVIIKKWLKIAAISTVTRRFLHDFGSGRDVLDYYLQRRKSDHTPLENIYIATCERLLKLLTPDARSLLMGRTPGSSAALSAREVELVRATCEHTLDEEEIGVEHGMGLISTVVALSPMLGLLGTVWGVLDAFADMGNAASASLATLAPSISAALLTTVVGLLVAFPGLIMHSMLSSQVRSLTSQMEGFADELSGRIACEFQGRAA